MQLKRIFHHAFWYTLLGPFVGIPVAIIFLAFYEGGDMAKFFLNIARELMFIMVFGWFLGAIPALLTGIAVACLPAAIYNCRWRRIVCSGIIGMAIALIIGAPVIAYFMTDKMLPWSVPSAGLVSGLVMGWAVIRLFGFTRLSAHADLAQ
ncbi:hypothetical protein ACVQTW_004054 [Klebsiella aerogenes]